MTEEAIKKILPHLCYTKEEVDILIRAAVEEARAIDLDVNILDDIAEKTKIIVENDLVKSGLNKIQRW